MDTNTKYVMAVFSLMLGLSLGVPYLVSEEQKPSWLMWAIFFLILALGFYLWIMREQRTAEEEAEETLDTAEENLKKLEDKAAAQEAPPKPAPAKEKAAPAPKPEPVAEDVKEPAKNLEEIEETAEDAKAGDPIAETEIANASAAPQAATAASDEPVDLTRIEGIGPKYADILNAAGISTYAQIAAMSEDQIVDLIKANGGRKSASMSTWAAQAKLAAAGDWDGLAKLQAKLSGGRG